MLLEEIVLSRGFQSAAITYWDTLYLDSIFFKIQNPKELKKIGI